MLGYLRSGNKRTKTIWWALTIITVASFLGGFVFLAGLGRDQSSRARLAGNVGSVNGEGVTTTQWTLWRSRSVGSSSIPPTAPSLPREPGLT